MMTTMNNNGENGRSLPDGWEWMTIGDVADTTSGGTPSRKYQEYFEGTIPWVKSGELGDGLVSVTEEKITETAIKNSSAKIFPAGSVLVALYGATVGKVGILKMDAASNQAVCALFPRENLFTAQYMFYWLMSQRQDLINKSVGGAQPNISQGIVRSHPFPLAPLPEQERIVNRIEELFSDLDAGVAALERVRVGLKRYKASVLKAACEGRLMASGHGAAVPVPGELPDGWRWARAEDICGFITKGTTPKPDKLFARSGEVPFIKVYNLTFDGSLDFSINPTFVSTVTHNGELARSKIIPGDVLMNIVGPPLGKVSIAPDTFPEWNMNQAVARFRPLEICDRKYLSIALRTESVLSWAIKRAKATAGQFNLTLEICRDLPIPLPPLKEQRRIVAEVERRLSVVGEVESAVEVGLVRAGRLRQSVLRSAFEGKLT